MSAPRGLPRLLAGIDESTARGAATLGRADHERVHGPVPSPAPGRLIAMVERSGLRGRGGADFPTATKLRSVAQRRRRAGAVVVNGSETEPASRKDSLLLTRSPHLVLDGAVLAADAVGAREVIVKVSDRSTPAVEAVGRAICERPATELPIRVVTGPDRYVAGEESAVIRLLNGGDPSPTFDVLRPHERGYRSRPTLIQNAETLAQIALIARHGPDWFRDLGTDADPGTVLVTVSGAVNAPGVQEVAFGTRLADVLTTAGGATEPLRAVLIGGYFGTWVAAADAARLRIGRGSLRAAGAALGAGVVIALPESAPGLRESARITRYLAGQSARQCGPCELGLAAIADGMTAIANGTATAQTHRDVRRWCADVSGRGACHHPTGVARFVLSALDVFAEESGSQAPPRAGRTRTRAPA